MDVFRNAKLQTLNLADNCGKTAAQQSAQLLECWSAD